MSDFTTRIIEEFRANEGRVGAPFQGATLLLLHTTGARSREERISPVAYLRVGDELAIFGSKRGAPTNPAWFHNLVANPTATVEVGAETYPVTARVAEGAEREAIWARQKEVMPGFAEYETMTSRTIPVVLLRRAG